MSEVRQALIDGTIGEEELASVAERLRMAVAGATGREPTPRETTLLMIKWILGPCAEGEARPMAAIRQLIDALEEAASESRLDALVEAVQAIGSAMGMGEASSWLDLVALRLEALVPQ